VLDTAKRCKRREKTREKVKMACRAKQKTIHVRVAARGNPGSNSHPSGSRSMAGPNFRLTNLASTKLLLHSLKYPHQTVNGVFLGRPSETDPYHHHRRRGPSPTPLDESQSYDGGRARVGVFSPPFAFPFVPVPTDSRVSCVLCGARPPIMPAGISFMWLDTTRHPRVLAT
jgi:hypothetical protein